MNKELLARFNLNNGQFFARYRMKNLWWFMEDSDTAFGFGDLTDQDILRIQGLLTEGEVFIGWNEHYGTPFQQSNHPEIRITKDEITFPHREAYERKD